MKKILGVAIGDDFCAAITDNLYCRIFRYSGIQHFIFCLPAPHVTITACGNLLAIVYHRGSVINGTQYLHYILFDMAHNKKLAEDQLPLSNGSQLRWLGFSDSLILCSVDTAGIVRCLNPQMDYIWCPLLDTNTIKKSGEFLWTVGVTDIHYMCVICRGDSYYPDVLPRPILISYPLCVPILQGDTQIAQMEANAIRISLYLSQLRKNNEILEDSSKIMMNEQQITKHEKSLDSTLIRLIDTSIKKMKRIFAPMMSLVFYHYRNQLK